MLVPKWRVTQQAKKKTWVHCEAKITLKQFPCMRIFRIHQNTWSAHFMQHMRWTFVRNHSSLWERSFIVIAFASNFKNVFCSFIWESTTFQSQFSLFKDRFPISLEFSDALYENINSFISIKSSQRSAQFPSNMKKN